MLLPLFFLFLALPQIKNGLQFHGSPEMNVEGLEIMSCNIFGLKMLRSGDSVSVESKESAFERFADRLQTTDIFCVQEINPNSAEILDRKISFPHVHKLPEKGTAIYTRYPILDSGEIDFGSNTNSCLWVDIDIDGKALRVYSAHLFSNKLSAEADKVLQSGELQRSSTWKEIRNIFGKYRRSAPRRVQQVELILKHVQNCKLPVVLCIDLNDPPQSFVYRQIADLLKDSFVECGNGFGFTYAGSVPFLRIDYIFFSSSIQSLGHEVIRDEFSDHFPIRSWLHFE